MLVSFQKVTDADFGQLLKSFSSSCEFLQQTAARSARSAAQSAAGLRALLSILDRMGVDSHTLVLKRAKSGKPYFAGSDLRFSIAHSEGLAVCAVAATDVGIDIEKKRIKKYAEGLAKRFYSDAECAIIDGSDDKSATFLEIWTKKEALLKMSGRGIDANLKAVDTTADGLSVFIVRDDGDEYIVSVCGEKEVIPIEGEMWIRIKR